MAKTYKLVTYGCAMNQSDSERIAATLASLGYRPATERRVADLFVFNACSVRQSGIDRLYDQISRLERIKRNRPQTKIIVTGCVLPKDRLAFQSRADLLFNIQDLAELPRLLQKIERGQKPSFPPLPRPRNRHRPKEQSYLAVAPQRQSSFSALVPLSSGCNKFCTYCAVPYTRGLEVDRSRAEILTEVASLVSRGFKEITLLGQTVSSWKDPGGPEFRFRDLLAEIEKMPGRFWVRYASPYVLDFDDELIDFLAQAEKVSHHLNLPLQSGDDQVLKRMNRKYTVRQYLAVLEKMKKRIPDFSFSTDVICGFCGESEKEFRNTRRIFRQIQPAMAYIARYSSRPGTVAAKVFQDDVAPEIKKARWQKLTKLLRQTAKENQQKEVNRTLEVLVDTWLPGKKECLAKTRNYKTVRFASTKNLVGQFTLVRILATREFELQGELI